MRQGTIAGRQFHLSFHGLGVRRFLVSPTSFDFGTVLLGRQSAPQAVTILNVSSRAASLNLLHFAVAGFPHTTTCAPTLAAHTSCRVVYRFAPTAPGLVEPMARPVISGQQATLQFSGTGREAAR